jgi:predicted restriction endonuclease
MCSNWLRFDRHPHRGHIVPWRDANESERLEIGNAILLSPLYDALFDRHLISFEDDGKIILSSQLTNRDDLVTSLRIDRAATIAVTEDMKPYLQRHREKLK